MQGIIGFENLKINCIIGIFPEERTTQQALFIDLKVQVELSQCIKSQDVKDTVDYARLAQFCIKEAENQHGLLEILANEILQKIFAEFDVKWAWIKIKKPQAIKDAQHAYVELEKGTFHT
jgi:7,8-dihydroneopterin aldolase/epimerase/oxygenase